VITLGKRLMHWADKSPSRSQQVPSSSMKERLPHADKLYRAKVSVNLIVALECGRILGAARRALRTNVH
jgi:hypothetical protein